jgi:hypothetical protein
MGASGDALPIAFTEPDLGFPPDVLDDLRLFFASPWEMATDLGGRAIRPGPFDQRPAGMDGTRLGHGTLAALLGAGVF